MEQRIVPSQPVQEVTAPPIVQVDNLCKRYDGFTAVDGISFAVQPGECFGLLGPNGAGKTSAIRMMYGFAPPSSGSLRIFGLDVATDWRQIRSRLGVCQQDNTLDPDLSVVHNLLVFAGYFRIPARQARQRAEELLHFFALEKKREAKVGELSGGLARRLTLARALINDPELIILDEPTTGLDPQSRHLLWERLQSLRTMGKTFILTTHYMEEAAQLCDRLVIMDNGKILVEGTPTGLIEAHVGSSIIEIRGADQELRQYLGERAIGFDEMGERLVIYNNGNAEIEQAIRSAFHSQQCTFRSASLEDVFLRLTGRELRE
jgi:lipooligosaccharide transport system ATP-binding protein